MDRHVFAVGGRDDPSVDERALALVPPSPRICLLATASGDSSEAIDRFYATFPSGRARATHLPLFGRQRGDLRARILANDVLYIGGGSTANLLALWRLHGVDGAVREAWEQGVVLIGVSAGASCLFEGSVTDSFGPSLSALSDGLGLISGTFCPHYDHRRGRYRQLVGEGFGPGIAAEDGAALHFVGTSVAEVLASRPGAGAWRVSRGHEERIA